jgi:hypothetical protein
MCDERQPPMGSYDPVQSVPTSIVPDGDLLSLLYVIMESGGDWYLNLSAKSKEIYGINFTIVTIQAMVPLAENTKMVVRFMDGWDAVENSPELIFEAPSVQDIEFRDANDQVLAKPPGTIRVQTNTFVPGGPRPAAPKEDGKKLGTGAIVGIVIGGVVVVAIAVVCGWYLVIREKPLVGGAEENPAQTP